MCRGGGNRAFCLARHADFGLILSKQLWRRRERRATLGSTSRKSQRITRKVTLRFVTTATTLGGILEAAGELPDASESLK